MEFDDREITTKDAKVGAKVADALLAKLSGVGPFELVDRQYIDTLIKEQNLKLDDRFDPTGAARIGKLANVSAVIVGRITAATANVSTDSTGGFGSKKAREVGHVELTASARLLNVETGVVIAALTKSTQPKSEVLSESSSLAIPQGIRNKLGGGSAPVDNAKKNGDTQVLLSKLVDKCVDELATQIAAEISSRVAQIPVAAAPALPLLTIKVMGVEGGAVFINKGQKDGIKVGTQYAIARSMASSLIDPDTGKPVQRMTKICTLSVAEVEDAMSSGKCQGEMAKAGDVATPVAK